MIELPWPPSTLSGHNNGHWRSKSTTVADHRAWAAKATVKAKVKAPPVGDIPIRIDFFPPDDRSDRVNFPNRMKPYFDGIADALSVNDKRFLPSYHFHMPIRGGKVLVTL